MNIFLKTFSIIFSLLIIILSLGLLLSFIDDKNNTKFKYVSGDKESSNTVAIIELSGLIIEKSRNLSGLTNPLIISPTDIKIHLDNLESISPEIIIFSINSPGGTVSASKNIYNIIKNFKKINKSLIFFHTSELLASGGYWASSAADEIYANYGSIVGRIGVKGPDWFFYDEPKSISTGIFGNRIETKEGIKVFSSTAGKSKDILNPFRKPTDDELRHLQSMVNEIYDDFVRVISKERKIESETIINEIGSLIYTSKKAYKLNLIDGELSLDDLISKIIKEKEFINYKIIKLSNQKNSLLKNILTGNFYKPILNTNFECLTLKSSISSVLSYQSTGC